MFAQDYLTLKLVRFKSPDEWANQSDGFLLLFPKGGAAKYDSKAGTHHLWPGDVLVLNGTAGGKLGVPNGGEMLFWHFSLCFEHMFPLFAANEIRLIQPVLDEFNSAKLYPASSAVAIACHQLLADAPPQFDLDHRSQLLRVIATILNAELKKVHRGPGRFIRIDEHIIEVLEKLSADELLTLSVGELAEKFSCSRRHLNRLFHQHFGFSVGALRMEMRLLKAVSLLRDPDAKVINVAERSGFNHLGLFNTCFKRRFGASPGRWRKMTLHVETQLHGLVGGSLSCPLRVSGLCPWTGDAENCVPLPKPTLEGDASMPSHGKKRGLDVMDSKGGLVSIGNGGGTSESAMSAVINARFPLGAGAPREAI